MTPAGPACGGFSALSPCWAGSCWWSSARPMVSPVTTGMARTRRPRSVPYAKQSSYGKTVRPVARRAGGFATMIMYSCTFLNKKFGGYG